MPMDADDTWKLCLSSGMAWILYTSIIPSPFSSVNASLDRLLLNNLPHPANLAVRQHDLDTMRVEAALCEQPLYNALSQLTRALVCLQHDFDPRADLRIGSVLSVHPFLPFDHLYWLTLPSTSATAASI